MLLRRCFRRFPIHPLKDSEDNVTQMINSRKRKSVKRYPFSYNYLYLKCGVCPNIAPPYLFFIEFLNNTTAAAGSNNSHKVNKPTNEGKQPLRCYDFGSYTTSSHSNVSNREHCLM